MINGTSSFDGIEELADVFVNVILLVTQHERAPSDLRVPSFGLLVRHAKVIRQSEQISLAYLYPIVAAAVGRALVAIVKNAQDATVRVGFSVFYDGFPQDSGGESNCWSRNQMRSPSFYDL